MISIESLRKRFKLPSTTDVKVKALGADFVMKDKYDFAARISAASLDRDDEVLLPSGMQSAEFERSGALFFNHDYDIPIGFPIAMRQADNGIMASGRFMERPVDYQGEFFPDFVRAFVSQANAIGRAIGVSVGFIPVESRQPTPKDQEMFGAGVRRVFSKWKLLEWSIAPVQSNPDAFVVAVGKGLITRSQVKSVFGFEVPESPKRREVVIHVAPWPTFDFAKIISDEVERQMARKLGRLYY